MAENQRLILVFMPSLVSTLLNRDKAKGSPLTEDEVIAIRDGAHCVATPADVVPAITEARGYEDIDPENVWRDWCAIRPSLYAVDG